MQKIDLIIDALENSEPTGTGWVHVHEQKHQAALAAARELQALKPVAWVTTEQFASTAHNVTRVSLHQKINGIPLYALDEVKHD